MKRVYIRMLDANNNAHSHLNPPFPPPPLNRDLKQLRRRRQGRRLEMNLYFTVEFRTCLDLFSTSIGLRTCSSLICNASVQFQKKIRKISRRRSRSPKYPELGHFTLSFRRGRLRNRLVILLWRFVVLSFRYGAVVMSYRRFDMSLWRFVVSAHRYS